MGKVTEKVRLTSLFDRTKSREVVAVIDAGATLLVLPQDLVEELGLTRIRDVPARERALSPFRISRSARHHRRARGARPGKVRYGNNSVEAKGVYGAVTLELKGRRGVFEALAEAPGSEPLVGQVVLESLDLTVDPRTRRVIPNPQSPETPMVEIL